MDFSHNRMSGGKDTGGARVALAKSALKAIGGALVMMGLLFVGWVSFWTFANPAVEVPAPLSLDVGKADDGGTGSILVLGDTSTGDMTGERRKKEGEGYQYADTLDLMARHDAVVVNLESPVTDCDDKWPFPKSYTYKMSRESLAALGSAGVDAVSLANNHVYDYGARGLADTLDNLEGEGIRHFGASMSEAGARRGMVIRTPGGRLGLLGYMQDKPRWRLWSLSFALDTPFRRWPGAARLDFADLAADLRRIRRNCDVVAVVVHWGENYLPVTERQRSLGRGIIELGADVVIGHHPHQMQPVEEHTGKLIIYSLGNYAFGTRGSRKMKYGMGASIHLAEGRINRIELTPLLTQNRMVRYRPRVPAGDNLEGFFGNLVGPSAGNGAKLIRKGDRAVWTAGNNLE